MTRPTTSWWQVALDGVTPPPPPPPPGPGNALQADSFNESFGVNYHANFGSSSQIPSYNFGASDAFHNAGIDHVGAMGCRYIRDLMPTSTSLSHQVNALYQRFHTNYGGKVCAHSGATRTSGDTMTAANALVNSYLDAVQALGGAGGGIFAAFEGINEPNNDGAGSATWVPETRNMQLALWQQAKARTAGSNRTDTTTILGPALARRLGGTFPANTAADYDALGDLTDRCDFGNIHNYPAGKQAGLFIPEFDTMADAVYPGLGRWVTEGGYFDAMSYTGGSDPTPEDVNAVYVIRSVLEHMYAGHGRYFDYQALDGPDSGNSSREDSFGFIDVRTTDPATWRRKAKWYAMKRMLSLMADPGATWTPPGLTYTVTTQAANFKSLLFQKRAGGKAYLVMWRDELLYKQKKVGGHFVGGSYVTVDNAPVSVTLAAAQPIALHKPSSQGSALTSSPYQTLSSRVSFSTTVAGEVVVAEIG